MLYCQLTINVSDWLLNVSVGACVGVVCLSVWCACHVALIFEHVREWRIMGVRSHYKQAVRYGRCVSEVHIHVRITCTCTNSSDHYTTPSPPPPPAQTC